MSHKSQHIQKLLEDRYYLRDEEGNLLENSPEEMYDRVACAISQAELEPKEIDKWGMEFFSLMNQNKFLPNTPTLINAGKLKPGCFSACFVLPVEDSMPGIFEAVKQSAIIMKAGGGVGYSFGSLREKGSIVKTTGHKASGPVSFMAAFDSMIDTVAQGGSRRGAAIAVLPVWHPDIEEFIEMKDSGGFTNFNISVGITDDFMLAVENDAVYPTILVVKSEKYDTGKVYHARDLWNKIVEHAWKTGDPGLVFLDTINKAHPLEEDIEATNPSLAAGTMVLTSNGIFPIEQLQDTEVSVLTLNGKWASAKCILSGKDKGLIKVKLEGGATYLATKEHKWPVLQKDGSYKKKYTIELRSGDYLAIGGSDTLPYGSEGTYDEGFMVGWNYGDGCIIQRKDDGKTQYHFIFSEEDIGLGCYDKVRNTIQSLTETIINPSARTRGTSVWKEVNSSNKKLDAFFKKHGFLGKEFGLPESFWSSMSEDFRKGFIDGLFSADGYFDKKGRVVLTSVHNKLVEDIALYLGFYGIKGAIAESKQKATFPNGKDYKKEYTRFDLKYMLYATLRFRSIFRITHPPKKMQLLEVKSPKRWTIEADNIRVVGIENSHLYEDVWDLQVYDDTHSFKLSHCITGNCGEIPLRPFESCNLGSINLMAYLKHDNNEVVEETKDEWYFDYDALAEDIPTMVRFLDDVIDVNPFPLPEIDKASKESRKIGLGIMGWADYLIKMKIPYDSQEAIDLAEELMKFIKDEAEKASYDLAIEKDTYPLFKKELDKTYTWRRNATLLCVAPTGTLSRIAGVSSGIEPIFSWNTHHKLVDLEYDEEHWAQAEVFSSANRKDIDIQSFKFPKWMKTANEIPWQWHLNMQSAFQKYVDNSISKTINLPTNATIDDVSDAYMLAWKYDLKGITIYRDNCKENQPLNKMYSGGIISSKELGKIVKEALGEGSGVYKGDKKIADFAPDSPSVEEQIQTYRKRGPVTIGVTHKVDTGKGKIYITINYSEYHAEPVEVFIRLGHASTTNEIALAEWAGRLVSLLLKHNVPLESVIRQGNKVFGDSIFWYNKASFSSFPRLISHLLSFTFEDAMNMAEMDFEAMMENGEEIFEPTYDISGEVTQGYCYQCGSYAIIGEGGCKVCQNCGYENCG